MTDLKSPILTASVRPSSVKYCRFRENSIIGGRSVTFESLDAFYRVTHRMRHHEQERDPGDDTRTQYAEIFDDLTIVSNREPYEHVYTDGDIELSKATGGLTTALDGVFQEVGGTWLAWGSGTADFDPEVVTNGRDYHPIDGRENYVLRRLDLSDRAVHGYYYGYSNQVLWPLCHLETEHIVYDDSFWAQYERVNTQFAEALDLSPESTVWFQDYHLARAPRIVREGGHTEQTLVHFWHIPWPPVEMFETCPQGREILDGLVGNDAVGFHVERYRDRFLECVDSLLPSAIVNEDEGTVRYRGRTTETYVVPVGVETASGPVRETSGQWQEKKAADGIDESVTLAVGVDRLDYTKGLVEKIDAFERVFQSNPDLRGDLTLVQKVSKSREKIPSYRQYHQRVLERIEDVNATFRTPDWEPIVYVDETFDRQTLTGLFEDADLGVVTPRRDGLNLVAEELVHASQSEPAVLLLSEFAGAAGLLGDGPVTVNPYHTSQFSDAIVRAIEMDDSERKNRHREMIGAIREYSLEDWLDRHTRLIGRLKTADDDPANE